MKCIRQAYRGHSVGENIFATVVLVSCAIIAPSLLIGAISISGLLLDQTCTFEPPSGQELSASEMLAWIREGKTFRLVDVRTKEESSTLPFGGYSAPFSTLGQFEQRLDPNIPVVIYCKAGVRSMKGLAMLKQRFPEVPFFSLANGTDGLLAQGVNPRLMQSYFDIDGLHVRKASLIS